MPWHSPLKVYHKTSNIQKLKSRILSWKRLHYFTGITGTALNFTVCVIRAVKTSKYILVSEFLLLLTDWKFSFPEACNEGLVLCFWDFTIFFYVGFFASGAYIGGPVSPLLRFYCTFHYSIHFTLEWSPIQVLTIA